MLCEHWNLHFSKRKWGTANENNAIHGGLGAGLVTDLDGRLSKLSRTLLTNSIAKGSAGLRRLRRLRSCLVEVKDDKGAAFDVLYSTVVELGN